MKITILSLFLLFSGFITKGQDYIFLSGNVKFEHDQSAVPFGYVRIVGKALGTVTDANGKFKLRLEEKFLNETISFSYLGHQQQNLKISEIKDRLNIEVFLKEEATLLKEAVVTNKKPLDAIKILKSALAKTEDNFHTDPLNFTGYYREIVKENEAPIMFSDAACEFYYEGYQKKDQKWKDFKGNGAFNQNSTLGGFSYYGGNRLHSYHFSGRTLTEDQVKVVESRASDNLSKTRLYASIERGPLGILGKDRVKFKEYFFKNFKKYDYSVKESLGKDQKWSYVVQFIPNGDTSKFKNTGGFLAGFKGRPGLLAGKVWIDEESLAITKISYSVPNHLKKFVCGYRENTIRHFDYKVDVVYAQHAGKYSIDYIRQEDEFIFHDTISDNTIPYRAISELHIKNVTTKEAKNFKPHEVFFNSEANQLFNYPLTYNNEFWESYQNEVPQAVISGEIRGKMEEEKSLERQFDEKTKRNEDLPAPLAEEIPYQYTHLGNTYTDEYAWMKDTVNVRSNNKVMDYLESENKFADNYFIPLKLPQRKLYTTLKNRAEQLFESLPSKINQYHYYFRYLPGEEYQRWYRKKIGSDKEELLLDVVERAKNKNYYSASPISISPDDNIMVYSENTDGSDISQVKFIDLNTRKEYADSIKGIGGITWKDNSHFFYSVLEKKTNRSYQVKFHELGRSYEQDELIAEEKDVKFSISVSKTKSKEFFVLSSGSNTSSESFILHKDDKSNNFKIIHRREPDLIYSLSHYKDKFYVFTNMNEPNYEIMVTDTSAYEKKNWKEFIKGRKGLMLNGFIVFENFFVVSEKKDTRDQIRVFNAKTMKSYYLKEKIDLPVFSMGSNPDFDTDSLQYSVEGPLNPSVVYKMHLETREKVVIKKTKIKVQTWGIKAERHWATARDGEKIPLTVIYNKWYNKSKTIEKRTFMTSYGSYGSSSTVGYNPAIFSLLSNRFSYVIAHVRGGSDMGKEWYDNGKMLKKKNTFYDFIDCTEYLIEKGFASRGNITIQGGSAGGLLVGAVANMRPDLFKAVILDVPFVDVINTMLDSNLPLTTGEYEEWGNPNEKEYFDYMKSYSPYDNVKQQAYPAMFFFTGLNDSRVSYWEPAKMIAKLRKTNTSDNIMLLKTDFFSGHGGSSGRFSYYQDLSYKYALIFELYKKKVEEVPKP